MSESPLSENPVGPVHYEWDLETDSIVWTGPWQSLFGEKALTPPSNAETFAATIPMDDQQLFFRENPARFTRSYRLHQKDGVVIRVQEDGETDFTGGRAVRQRGTLRRHTAPSVAPLRSYGTLGVDPLTGRPDRAAMQAQIDHAIKAALTQGRAGSYLVIGLDKMSFVNEAVGAKIGDALLKAAAQRLADLCPSASFLGRVGGDLFGVLLPNPAVNADQLAQKFLRAFHDHPILADTVSLPVSLSIGSTSLEGAQLTASEAMIHAEQALHQAREAGRGRHVIYNPHSTKGSENRTVIDITARVKLALANNSLRLAYQPVIEAESGQVLFYEALARLFKDDGQLMPAADFIPVVEEQGLTFEFDKHVLAIAVKELVEAPALRLAVNVSGFTAEMPDWSDHIKAVLSANPGVAERLIVEITETAAVMDAGRVKDLVQAMHDMGSQVALDDFGAGATSIRQLRSLSLSIMKIDRELLVNLTHNDKQQHLVRTLIELARGLGLKTVAEGIETEEVATWLRDAKVDMMQGYYFGRPALNRPWRDLKGAEATEEQTKEALGRGADLQKGYAEIHVTSISTKP